MAPFPNADSDKTQCKQTKKELGGRKKENLLANYGDRRRWPSLGVEATRSFKLGLKEKGKKQLPSQTPEGATFRWTPCFSGWPRVPDG